MTILEKIKFEEDWLSEVNLTKENIKIAFAGIRATALEQQPCEDCISREETILHISERLYETAMNNQGYEITMDKACEDIAVGRLKTWINELASVTPSYNSIKTELEQTKWIPVSERLPEENGYYLTTTMCHEVYCDYWEEKHFNRTEAVIAWMPLPQPYKEGEDEGVN